MIQEFHQVLIIKPNFSFEQLMAIMSRMGWQYDSIDLGEASLIENEPEVATWSWSGQKPWVIYTFNPVVKMRVLDVAGLPPRLREALAMQLPLIDNPTVTKLLHSPDKRERLLGLWVAQETERLDLIEHTRQLSSDTEPVLAEQARTVCEKLERIEQARLEVLVQMRIMEEAAPQLIRQMNDPAFVQKLMPTRADLATIFDEPLVDAAYGYLQQLYAGGQLAIELPPQATLEVVACPAGLMRWANMLSNKLPGGFRDIAGWMIPNRIWIGWKVETETTCMSYDGLVWVDDHWCWLPKIYRALMPYLLQAANGQTRH